MKAENQLGMKQTAILTIVLTLFILCDSVNSQSDLVSLLLDLPAPPAVNKDFNPGRGADTPGFYDHRFPPYEDAPIDEVLLYWKQWNRIEPGSAFTIIPSLKTVERIFAEIEDDPGIMSILALRYLTVAVGFNSKTKCSPIPDRPIGTGKV